MSATTAPEFTARDARDLYLEVADKPGQRVQIGYLARLVAARGIHFTEVHAAFDELKALQPEQVALRECTRGRRSVAIGR